MRLDERGRQVGDLRRLRRRAAAGFGLACVELVHEAHDQRVVPLVALVLESPEHRRAGLAGRQKLDSLLLARRRKPLAYPRLDRFDRLHLFCSHKTRVYVELAPFVERQTIENACRVDRVPLGSAGRNLGDAALGKLGPVRRLALKRPLLYLDSLERKRRKLDKRHRVYGKNQAHQILSCRGRRRRRRGGQQNRRGGNA